MNRRVSFDKLVSALGQARVSRPAILAAHYAPDISHSLQVVDQSSDIRLTHEHEFAEIAQQHSFRFGLFQQHQNAQGRFGKSVLRKKPAHSLMQQVVGVDDRKNSFDRELVHSRIKSSTLSRPLRIERLAPVFPHMGLILVQIVKFLIILASLRLRASIPFQSASLRLKLSLFEQEITR